MALVKTNYGLIYNDDGSLCTTIRADDIPFEVVKSFAVEEGTINVLSSILSSDSYLLNYFNPSDRGTTEIDTTVTPPVENQKVIKHYATTTDSYIYAYDTNGITYIHSSPAKMQVTAESYVTFSIWAKGQKGGEEIDLIIFEYPDDSSQYSLPTAKATFNLTTEWKRYTLTIQTRSDTQRVWARVDNNVAGTTVYWCAPQLEEKPFATSFVDGTRPDGQLIIDNLPAGTPKVISAWIKFPKTVCNDIFEMLLSLQEPGWNNLIAEAWWFGFNGGRLKFREFAIGSSPNFWTMDTGLTLADLYNKWVFLTIAETSSTTTDVYVKGEGIDYKGTLVLEKPYNFRPSRLRLCSWEGGGAVYYKTSALFANLLIARYDPNIWTDEYIRELYNARKPFAAPPRLPII